MEHVKSIQEIIHNKIVEIERIENRHPKALLMHPIIYEKFIIELQQAGRAMFKPIKSYRDLNIYRTVDVSIDLIIVI